MPLVENGYFNDGNPVTKLIIAEYLQELKDAGVDTLILGCTHYPLLKTMIGEFMGQSVTLVDPAKTAAHHLEQMLSRARPARCTGARGSGALLRERCAGQLCADGRPVPGRVQGRPGGSDRH